MAHCETEIRVFRRKIEVGEE
uniref:Uncharacterized protein n=1 Tax=Arundo donax TaxID=35708 RepID=A0A0A9B936_ARUDO